MPPATAWTPVDPALPALTCTYSFGPGLATSIALAVDGGFAVVSPPCGVPDSIFRDLESHGPIRALVAPNAVHTMGLRPWKERYPAAPIYAPAASIPRLERTTKLTGIQTLADLKGSLGDRVEFIDMPHYKSGEALVRWRMEGQKYGWFLTDVVFNMTPLPPGPFGLFLRLTGSGPGLRRNVLSAFFAVKDRRALYAWLNEQARLTPPALLVPCHGAVVRPEDPVAALQAALR